MNEKIKTGKRRQHLSGADNGCVELARPMLAEVELRPLLSSDTTSHCSSDIENPYYGGNGSSASTGIKIIPPSICQSRSPLRPKFYAGSSSAAHHDSPAVGYTSGTSNSPNNHIQSDLGTIPSKSLQLLMDRFQFMNRQQNHLFHFQGKDRRDVSGKRGFRVQVPTRMIMYIVVFFIVVPVFAGIILLIRQLLSLHESHTHSPEIVKHTTHTNETFAQTYSNDSNHTDIYNTTYDGVQNQSLDSLKDKSANQVMNENITDIEEQLYNDNDAMIQSSGSTGAKDRIIPEITPDEEELTRENTSR